VSEDFRWWVIAAAIAGAGGLAHPSRHPGPGCPTLAVFKGWGATDARSECSFVTCAFPFPDKPCKRLHSPQLDESGNFDTPSSHELWPFLRRIQELSNRAFAIRTVQLAMVLPL
jgi:hypothetical protein